MAVSVGVSGIDSASSVPLRPTTLIDTAFGAVSINMVNTPTVVASFNGAICCKVGPAVTFTKRHRLPFVTHKQAGRTQVHITENWLGHDHFEGHDPVQLICTRVGVLPGKQNPAEPTEHPLHHFRSYFAWLIEYPNPRRGWVSEPWLLRTKWVTHKTEAKKPVLVPYCGEGDLQIPIWQALDMSWLQEEHLQLGNEGLAVDGPLPQVDADRPWSRPANAVNLQATRPANHNLRDRGCSPSNCCCIVEDLSRDTGSIISNRWRD